MFSNPKHTLGPVIAICLVASCQQAPEKPPVSSAEMGSRVSRYVENRRMLLGATDAQASYCFVKLNHDMDANHDVDPALHEGDRGSLAMIEGYEKTFMDKCLADLQRT